MRRCTATAILHCHARDWVYVPSGERRFAREVSSGGPPRQIRWHGNRVRRTARPAGVSNAMVCRTRGSNGESPSERIEDQAVMRGLITTALNNRFMVMALAVLLLVGAPSRFHNSGRKLSRRRHTITSSNHSGTGRAAEEVEQQVTIPIEIQMNEFSPAAPALVSLFGLSSGCSSSMTIGKRLEPAEGARKTLLVAFPLLCSRRGNTD